LALFADYLLLAELPPPGDDTSAPELEALVRLFQSADLVAAERLRRPLEEDKGLEAAAREAVKRQERLNPFERLRTWWEGEPR
jgi:hypothetical protein